MKTRIFYILFIVQFICLNLNAQETKSPSNIQEQEIIAIDSIVASFDQRNYRIIQNLNMNDSEYGIIKTITCVDSNNVKSYSYELKFNDKVKIETKEYYHESNLVFVSTTTIIMIEKEKLDHDGMPIRKFPITKTKTYYINGLPIKVKSSIIE